MGMKEQYCTVTTNYTADWADGGYHEESVRLPDGNMIVMGKETFLAPEIMFQPSLASKKSCGLSQLIYYSVLKCDESIRSELVNNITLSGGNTKFPGFEKRMYQELAELFDEKTNIKVRALPNRDLLGWVGAARLSNLSSFRPQIKVEGEKLGSTFDALEDMDAEACLAKCCELSKLNKPAARNSAFVFIKPHAVTDKVKELAKAGLEAAG